MSIESDHSKLSYFEFIDKYKDVLQDKCRVCGRTIWNELSRVYGIGQRCRKKIGFKKYSIKGQLEFIEMRKEIGKE